MKKKKSYWAGTGKFQKRYIRLRDIDGPGDVLFAARVLYCDHFNNGSCNIQRSCLEDVREANISRSKEFIKALDQIQECFDKWTKAESSDPEVCPCCGSEKHDDGPEDSPDDYNDAFETMMDFVLSIKAAKLLRQKSVA